MKIIHTIFIVLTLLFFAFTVSAQTETPTEKQICISQTDANECAKRALEAKALREKIAELEAAREEDKKSIEDLKTQNRKLVTNAARLEGELSGAEKMKAEQRAIIQALLDHPRKKFSLIDIF